MTNLSYYKDKENKDVFRLLNLVCSNGVGISKKRVKYMAHLALHQIVFLCSETKGFCSHGVPYRR